MDYHLNGELLVVLDETLKHIGEISAIVILFIAGLEIKPREFLRGGGESFTVGSLGVMVPFLVGYYVFTLYDLPALELVLVATALTATSIAISVQVLSELGKIQSNTRAAIVDDILAIAALSVVTTMVQTGNTAPDILEITFLILKILDYLLSYWLEQSY